MERATLRLILSTAILVVFCTYIFIEIGRNPSTVVYVEGTPTGNNVTLQYDDCFDLDTSTISPFDWQTLSCPGSAWDFYLRSREGFAPSIVIWQNQLNQTRIAFSPHSFEDFDLSLVKLLTFADTLPDSVFDQVAIIQTSTGNYYKVQLVSETRNKNRATIQWEQVR